MGKWALEAKVFLLGQLESVKQKAESVKCKVGRVGRVGK